MVARAELSSCSMLISIPSSHFLGCPCRVEVTAISNEDHPHKVKQTTQYQNSFEEKTMVKNETADPEYSMKEEERVAP